MGACGSTNDKKSAKQPKPNSNAPESKAQVDNQIESSKSKPQEQKDDIIKAVPVPTTTMQSSIKIIIKENNQILLEQAYASTQTLKEVYDKLPQKKKGDFELLTKDNKVLQYKSQEKLETLFNNQAEVELTLQYVGLSLPENIRKAYAESTTKIGTIILDNPEMFGVALFDCSNQNTSTFNYSFEEFTTLKKFNSFSAFCNGQDKIFLSGGELNATENIGDFVQIDLDGLTEKKLNLKTLPNLIQARTWHSMIYIPNKYIFIVSGTGNKTVELYDIESNTISLDSELNEERSECTLCCINNEELYAFCGFLIRETWLNTIERCNLRKCTRQWENVSYTCSQSISFNPSFFSIGLYGNEGGVILFGSNENTDEKNKNYLFQLKPEGETIYEYVLNENLNGVYREKFFMPFNEEYSCIIPLLSTEIQVYLLDHNKGKIKKTEFMPLNNNEHKFMESDLNNNMVKIG